MNADVIIAGAGPAGCAAALTLASRGRRVIVVERAPLPQHKACGDALLPDALQALERLGLEAAVTTAGRPVGVLRMESAAGFEVELQVRAVTLRRQALHNILQERVRAAGVTLLSGEVLSPVISATGRLEGVQFRNEGVVGELRAPLVILATGARPETLKRFGVCLREEPNVVAIRTYYRSRNVVCEDALRICYHAAVTPGYGWFFPLPDNLYNIGLGHFLQPGERADQLYLQQRLEFLTHAFRPAREVAAEDDPVGVPCGWILRTGLTGAARFSSGVLVTGEAVGSTSPLLGDGIGKALETGEIAGSTADEALSAGRCDAEFLARYGERLDERFGALFRSRQKVEKQLRSPERLDLLIRKAARSAAVREGLEAVLNRNLPPTEVLSFWKLFFA